MVRMPAVVIGDHGNGHIAQLGLARELRFLQIGHADHIHAPRAIEIRFRLRRKLWPLHANISPATLPHDAGLLASRGDDRRQLRTYRIGEGNVRYYAITEKSIHAMTRAIHKLVRDYELKRPVFFFERANGGNGKNALNSELLEAVNVRAEVQLAGQNAVSAPVPGQKGDFLSFERAENVSVRRRAERSLLLHFVYVGQAGHGIQPAAADDSNFSFRQMSPLACDD